MFGSQTWLHMPQFSWSSSVLTQTPSQISSPRPVHSPPVSVIVVLLPALDELSELDEPPSELDDDVLSELDDEVDVEVVGSDVDIGSDDDVGSRLDDDCPFVLDIESIPVDAALSESLVDPVVSSPPPPQAHRARPTSVVIRPEGP